MGKNIKKQLKREAEQHTPDPFDKITAAARSENLLPNETRKEGKRSKRPEKTSQKKRGLIFGLSSAFTAAALVVVITLSVLLTVPPHVPSDPQTPSSPPHTVSLSVNDVYGLGAVSLTKLLGSGAGAAPASENESGGNVNSADDIKQYAEKFNEYFVALDSFFGENIISTNAESNPDEEYPYAIKLTVSGKNINGETLSYVMYYTETLKTDENFENGEREYLLIGVMLSDGREYYLEGERSEETENDESENELKLRAYADKNDRLNYIEMEQEFSKEDGETETEYVYSVYANGVLIEQTAVEFETEREGGTEEVEYELEFISGGARGSYKIERETQGNQVEIKVEYNVDGRTGEFKIREIKGLDGSEKYEYEFSDETKLMFEK